MSEMDEPSDEISLLDLLLVIAQNWLLLVIGPALIGAITFGVFVSQPQIYRSEVTIGLPVPVVEALRGSYSARREFLDRTHQRLLPSLAGERRFRGSWHFAFGQVQENLCGVPAVCHAILDNAVYCIQGRRNFANP